jgi:hypothetical protein
MVDDLIPVSSSFKLGESIPFSIYENMGTVLIKAGVVITIQKQIDRIIEEGCISLKKKRRPCRPWLKTKKC